MLRHACLSLFVVATAALRAPAVATRVPAAGPRPRARRVAMTEEPPDETEAERRARLEELGRQAAAEAAFLDSAPASGDDLMAEFNKRLDDEGGATVFKAKVALNEAGESAKETADGVKRAGQDVASTATGALSRLTTQQKNIAKIVGGLILFNIVIQLIGGIFGGGGGQGYSV